MRSRVDPRALLFSPEAVLDAVEGGAPAAPAPVGRVWLVGLGVAAPLLFFGRRPGEGAVRGAVVGAGVEEVMWVEERAGT